MSEASQLIGGNNPPPREQALLEVEEMLAEFEGQPERYIRSADSQLVRTREEAGDAADTLKLADTIWQKIKDRRVEITDPYRDAHSAAIEKVNRFWFEADAAMKRLKVRINAFREREREQIATQQREQAEEEARLREAAGNSPPAPAASQPVAPKPKPIVGDYGGRVMDGEQKVYTIEDVQLVPDFILKSPKVTKAITDVAKDFGKHMLEIPGIRIDTIQTSKVL